jgi:hypothetical protein
MITSMNSSVIQCDRTSQNQLSKVGGIFLAALFCLGLTGCFRASSDTQALRDSLIKSANAEWDKTVEFGVGGLTLGLVRAGLSFVDLDPEARAALHAAQGADVGVYKRHDTGKQLDHPAMLLAADRAMTGRGWDRMIAVVNPRELVAVYVPDEVVSTGDVKVCFVVVSGSDMVVASARSNLEPLLELAFSHERRLPIPLKQ